MATTSEDDLLVVGPQGSLFIGSTGVRLERIITAHLSGQPPADIVDMFDGLTLADVEKVLARYRESPTDIDDYMRRYEEEGARITALIEKNRMAGESVRANVKRRAAARVKGNGKPE